LWKFLGDRNFVEKIEFLWKSWVFGRKMDFIQGSQVKNQKSIKNHHFSWVNCSTAFLGHPGAINTPSGFPDLYFRSVFTEYVKKIKI
jgi:hypothetical protein